MADRTVEVDVIASDKTGPGMDSAARKAESTAAKIKESFRKAGDESGRESERGISRGFANVGKKVADIAGKIGETTGSKIATGISNSINNASPQVQAAIGGAVVAAIATLAPLLSAAVAGAVVGGAAIGGVVGGIALAAQHPQVKGFGAQIGQSIFGKLKSQADVFVGPVLGALAKIEARFEKLGPTIQKGFTASARYVAPLTDALLDAGEAITRSLVMAMQNAGPVVASIANGIRGIGGAVANMIALFSKLGPEGASAFTVIFKAIEFTIGFIGTLIYALAKVYGWVTTLGGLLGNDGAGAEKMAEDFSISQEAIDGATEALNGTATAAAGAQTAIESLAEAQNRLGNAVVAFDQAELNYKTTLAETNKVREHGKTVTDAERQALITLRGTMGEVITAYEATGATQTQVQAKTAQLRADFIKQAVQMGLTRAKAEELATSYGLLPASKNTNVTISGAEAARRELERVRARADSVPDQINIAIRVTGSNASRAAIAAALGKQSLTADRVAASFGHAEASYAGRGFTGFGRLGGANVVSRSAPTEVSVHNRLRVDLDGRALAPEMYRVTRRATREQRWRDTVGRR